MKKIIAKDFKEYRIEYLDQVDDTREDGTFDSIALKCIRVILLKLQL